MPAQGRQRDGPRYSDPPPLGPPRPRLRGGWQTAPPPATPGAGTPRTRRPARKGEHNPKQGKGRTGPGHPPPPRSKPDRARVRGRKPGGARTAWNSLTGGLHRNQARCAPHTDLEREEGRGRRESASAHTRKGHAGNTRRATGPSPPNAQTAWNGVPAGEGKGHPDGTTRNTQRRERGTGEGERGKHETRRRAWPPRPAGSAAHTQTRHCSRQGSSGAPIHAPAPRLGSLCASPRGSHWRQANSTGLAALAPGATTH